MAQGVTLQQRRPPLYLLTLPLILTSSAWAGRGATWARGMKIFFYRVPSAPPCAWPAAIDPWQLSGPAGQGGGGGESHTRTQETYPPCPWEAGLSLREQNDLRNTNRNARSRAHARHRGLRPSGAPTHSGSAIPPTARGCQTSTARRCSAQPRGPLAAQLHAQSIVGLRPLPLGAQSSTPRGDH